MEGTEKNPSKKTKREGKKPCQVGYCLGSVDMVQIPSGVGAGYGVNGTPF